MSGAGGIGQAILGHDDAGDAMVEFSGTWVQGAEITALEPLIAALAGQHAPRRLKLTVSNLEAWDSRLPTYILKIIDHCQGQGIDVDAFALPEGVQGLLKLARAVPERAGARRISDRTPMLASLGKAVLGAFKDAHGLVEFVGESILAGGVWLSGKARFRMVDLLLCIQETGPGALAIVTLISILVGLDPDSPPTIAPMPPNSSPPTIAPPT